MAESTAGAQDGAATPTAQAGGQDGALTPALVREVADKVYALWLADLQLERERYHRGNSVWRNPRFRRG